MREAEADAWNVCQFLNALGFAPAPDRPDRFSAEFMLDLAAALRLHFWERAGLEPRRIANLPLAQDAMAEVFQSAVNPQRESGIGPPGSLAQRVLAAYIDHFVWEARVELKADVVLGEADEEAMLEALADFLWEHRPR
jgi:hypothetical protein